MLRASASIVRQFKLNIIVWIKENPVNKEHSWCILNSLNKQKKRKEIGYPPKYQGIERNNISYSFNNKIESSREKLELYRAEKMQLILSNNS